MRANTATRQCPSFHHCVPSCKSRMLALKLTCSLAVLDQTEECPTAPCRLWDTFTGSQETDKCLWALRYGWRPPIPSAIPFEQAACASVNKKWSASFELHLHLRSSHPSFLTVGLFHCVPSSLCGPSSLWAFLTVVLPHCVHSSLCAESAC